MLEEGGLVLLNILAPSGRVGKVSLGPVLVLRPTSPISWTRGPGP